MREQSSGPPHPQRFALWQEITLVLVIKLIALGFIWLACFSAPTSRHVDADGVSHALLKTPALNDNLQETGNASGPRTR